MMPALIIWFVRQYRQAGSLEKLGVIMMNKLRHLYSKLGRRSFSQRQCFALFLSLALPIVIAISFLREGYPSLFYMLSILLGWLAWTFMEYIIHRFWMHGKDNKLSVPTAKKHLHHHTHPGEIAVTAWQRTGLVAIAAVMIYFSSQWNNYSNLLAGFYLGFAAFYCMHYLLHQTWSAKFFKHLLSYHIYHHCKYPDRCHGISATWWDEVFNTAPPKNAAIPQRILDFYFEKNHH